jgi:2-polyprenyl-6-methoxyphenol hydroxylase-like FAD-dependent oxidoreductase
VRPKPVVLGCGIAGIAAAAALRSVAGEVLVFEKDALPSRPTPRRGVPQGGQLHNLLACAQVHLDRLLPGFGNAIRGAGAGVARVSDETLVFELGRRMPERDLGMRLMCAPRPVIEDVARRLLRERGGVSIREGVRAVEIAVSPAGAVDGVVLSVNGRRETVPASLVVDATGSQSAAPRWLRAVGRDPPRVEAARVSQWYVSSLFERPREWVGKDRFWLVFPTPPKTRGGLVSPVASDRWHVSMSGRRGDEPPRTIDDVRAYAATLEAPWIGELLAGARGVGKPHLFRRLTARWRRFDLLDDPVLGFLPIGDAVVSLNPLLGQGISVAAWQAAGLADLLETAPRGELTKSYLARAADAARAAWTLGQLVEPDPPRDGAPHLRSEDFDAFGRLLEADAELHRRYVGVWHLVEPASMLASPEITSRIDVLKAAPG